VAAAVGAIAATRSARLTAGETGRHERKRGAGIGTSRGWERTRNSGWGARAAPTARIGTAAGGLAGSCSFGPCRRLHTGRSATIPRRVRRRAVRVVWSVRAVRGKWCGQDAVGRQSARQMDRYAKASRRALPYGTNTTCCRARSTDPPGHGAVDQCGPSTSSQRVPERGTGSGDEAGPRGSGSAGAARPAAPAAEGAAEAIEPVHDVRRRIGHPVPGELTGRSARPHRRDGLPQRNSRSSRAVFRLGGVDPLRRVSHDHRWSDARRLADAGCAGDDGASACRAVAATGSG